MKYQKLYPIRFKLHVQLLFQPGQCQFVKGCIDYQKPSEKPVVICTNEKMKSSPNPHAVANEGHKQIPKGCGQVPN